MDLKSFNTAIF